LISSGDFSSATATFPITLEPSNIGIKYCNIRIKISSIQITFRVVINTTSNRWQQLMTDRVQGQTHATQEVVLVAARGLESWGY